MIWAGLLCAAILIAPFIVELGRRKMSRIEQAQAPGRMVALSQGRTHCQWHGPRDGPMIVCVHGLTSPSFSWEPLAQRLADDGYRVLTYDLYGRGFSDRPAGPQDRDFFLRQLSDLMRAEEVPESIALIGYSMGGAIATAYAAAHPAQIRHLVLLAPAGMGQVGGPGMRALLRMPLLGLWAILALYPALLRRGLDAGAKSPHAMPEIITRQKAELNWQGFLPAVRQSLRGLLAEDLRADHIALAKAHVPVIAIWGRQDEVIPLSAAQTLESWNPSVASTVLDEAGHELAYTHASAVMNILRERLN